MTPSPSDQTGLSRELKNDELKITSYLINRAGCSKKYCTEVDIGNLKLVPFGTVDLILWWMVGGNEDILAAAGFCRLAV